MKPVEISGDVMKRIDELFHFIIDEYKSERTAHQRIDDINIFLQSLGGNFLLAKCRRKKWHERGYRCAVFDHKWVFAYQVYAEKVIVHDMEYASKIIDVID
ncbi:MAG: hypothetical protein LBV39_03740 [Bacteroidales bacterium]|jgi:hypothetical protein|nr:hypothetical protein [Bacteroidales bacterium]